MSIRVIAAIWENGPPDATDRSIFVCLAFWASDSGDNCFPSMETISNMTCRSVKTVQRSIEALERDGWLEVRRGTGRGHTSNYVLNVQKLRAKGRHPDTVSEAVKGDTVTPFEGEERESPCPIKGDIVTVKGVTLSKPPHPLKGRSVNDPLPDPVKSREAEPDSVDARILSESVGIFGMREQADMQRCLVAYSRASGKSPPDSIAHMIARWELYKSTPGLQWRYGSSYKFFMSGQWDHSENWQQEKSNGASQPGVTKQRVNASIERIARNLEARGIRDPFGAGGADGAEVPEPGAGAVDRRLSGGLRKAGPEVLPPAGRGGDG